MLEEAPSAGRGESAEEAAAMNRSVPTVLGIIIILMVAALVMLIYDYKLTVELASGSTLVGTVGGRLLTAAEQSTEQPGMRTVSKDASGVRPRASPVEPQRINPRPP